MIITFDEIEQVCKQLRNEGKKIVFTNGCFDIIHSGHIDYLSKAKNLGNILIVGLNSDSSVRRLKGERRPILSEGDRAIILDALKPVDYVVIFDEDTPYKLIQIVQPNFLVKGGDYRAEEVVGYDIVTKSGGKVVIFPYLEGKSTSLIINKIIDLYCNK